LTIDIHDTQVNNDIFFQARHIKEHAWTLCGLSEKREFAVWLLEQGMIFSTGMHRLAMSKRNRIGFVTAY